MYVCMGECGVFYVLRVLPLWYGTQHAVRTSTTYHTYNCFTLVDSCMHTLLVLLYFFTWILVECLRLLPYFSAHHACTAAQQTPCTAALAKIGLHKRVVYYVRWYKIILLSFYTTSPSLGHFSSNELFCSTRCFSRYMYSC